MKLTYKLVGYDRTTERVGAEYDIPADKVVTIKKYLGINDRDVADVPLDSGQAREIAHVLDVRLDLDNLDFFLEPSHTAVHA
jgi:hypothetical protein